MNRESIFRFLIQRISRCRQSNTFFTRTKALNSFKKPCSYIVVICLLSTLLDMFLDLWFHFLINFICNREIDRPGVPLPLKCWAAWSPSQHCLSLWVGDMGGTELILLVDNFLFFIWSLRTLDAVANSANLRTHVVNIVKVDI